MGQVLRKQEKFAEAESVRREALTMLKESLGPQHPEVAEARKNLIWTLSQLRKFAEAEPLMLETHDFVQQNPKAPPTEKRATIERLWKFYIEWAAVAPGTGKMDKASEWRKRLTEFEEASSQSKPG